jgi:citrate lyase beta subunit
MHTRRALLFMPGDDRRKIEKGAALGADAVIMDLEDGVALNRKVQARETIAAALREVDFGRTKRLVRINPVADDGLYAADLEATAPHKPDGYVLPKVESAQQVHEVSQRLNGTFHLLAIIETARGVVNLREIAESGVSALIFGAEDLAADIGAVRTPDGWEVFYARSAVVVHARAAGIQAIDTIYAHLENIVGLTAETEQALYMGFDGKLAIHPRQVDVIQKVFTPSAEQIERAQQLIESHEAHQAAGTGVFVFEGRMVDRPMIRAAEVVLARARAAGILDT